MQGGLLAVGMALIELMHFSSLVALGDYAAAVLISFELP